MKGQKGQKGGGVTLPSEYFSGQLSGQYYETGNAALNSNYSTAYPSVDPASSSSTFGKDLAPGGFGYESSGIQTGGGGRKTRSKKEDGGFVPELMNLIGNLVVPISFLAGRHFLVSFTEKGDVAVKEQGSTKKKTSSSSSKKSNRSKSRRF